MITRRFPNQLLNPKLTKPQPHALNITTLRACSHDALACAGVCPSQMLDPLLHKSGDGLAHIADELLGQHPPVLVLPLDDDLDAVVGPEAGQVAPDAALEGLLDLLVVGVCWSLLGVVGNSWKWLAWEVGLGGSQKPGEVVSNAALEGIFHLRAVEGG